MLTEIHWWQRVHEVRAKQKKFMNEQNKITPEELAQLIYEKLAKQIGSNPIWEYMPSTFKETSVKSIISLIEYTNLENVEEHHNVWWEEMKSLNVVHPHMVPFKELPEHHQMKHIVQFEMVKEHLPRLIYEKKTDTTTPRPVHPLASGAD